MTARAPRILVIEDDATLRDGLARALRGQGYHVEVAADGEAGQRALLEAFDLVVLDLMLPKIGGLELLRGLRARDARTPVLVLTARGDETDKVVGLELGADDYVTKPFGLRELLARVRAHLRRREVEAEAAPAAAFTLAHAQVDLAAFTVTRAGATVSLSPKEAAILALLHRDAGRAVSRTAILDHVWGRGVYVSQRTIDTHVLNLRQKVEDDARAPRHILTVHGVGYRLVMEGGA